MLSKKNRISKKDIDLLFKKGKSINTNVFTFKHIKVDDFANPRISFITPKSITKLAVERNLLRRKGYCVLKKYIQQLPIGTIGVFIFKKKEKEISRIENEIKNILNKIN